jgi:hypothetical protein
MTSNPPANPTSKSTQADLDTIQARINVALAKSQRIVASWLPPQPSSPTKGSVIGDKEDDQNEDDDMFRRVPAR